MVVSLPITKTLLFPQCLMTLFSLSQDPSVTQLTNAPQGGLAEFNPFSETNAATTVPVSQMPGPSQPAVLQPSVEPTQPTPQVLLTRSLWPLLSTKGHTQTGG